MNISKLITTFITNIGKGAESASSKIYDNPKLLFKPLISISKFVRDNPTKAFILYLQAFPDKSSGVHALYIRPGLNSKPLSEDPKSSALSVDNTPKSNGPATIWAPDLKTQQQINEFLDNFQARLEQPLLVPSPEEQQKVRRLYKSLKQKQEGSPSDPEVYLTGTNLFATEDPSEINTLQDTPTTQDESTGLPKLDHYFDAPETFEETSGESNNNHATNIRIKKDTLAQQQERSSDLVGSQNKPEGSLCADTDPMKIGPISEPAKSNSDEQYNLNMVMHFNTNCIQINQQNGKICISFHNGFTALEQQKILQAFHIIHNLFATRFNLEDIGITQNIRFEKHSYSWPGGPAGGDYSNERWSPQTATLDSRIRLNYAHYPVFASSTSTIQHEFGHGFVGFLTKGRKINLVLDEGYGVVAEIFNNTKSRQDKFDNARYTFEHNEVLNYQLDALLNIVRDSRFLQHVAGFLLIEYYQYYYPGKLTDYFKCIRETTRSWSDAQCIDLNLRPYYNEASFEYLVNNGPFINHASQPPNPPYIPIPSTKNPTISNTKVPLPKNLEVIVKCSSKEQNCDFSHSTAQSNPNDYKPVSLMVDRQRAKVFDCRKDSKMEDWVQLSAKRNSSYNSNHVIPVLERKCDPVTDYAITNTISTKPPPCHPPTTEQKTIPTTPPPVPTTQQPTSTELPQNLLIKVQCNSTEHCTIKVSENLNPRSNSNIPVEIYQNGELHEIRECSDDWRHWLSNTFVQYTDQLYQEFKSKLLTCPETMTTTKATITPQATTTQEPIITQGAATIIPQSTTTQEPIITQNTKTPSATTSTSTTTEKTTKTAYAMSATSAEVDSTSPEPAANHGSAPPYIWQIGGISGGIFAGLILIGGSIIMCKKKKWLCWSHGDNDQTKTHKNAEYKLAIQENGPSTDSDNSSSFLKTPNNTFPVFMIENNKVDKIKVPFHDGYNYIIQGNTSSSITVTKPPPPPLHRLSSILSSPQHNDPYIPPLNHYYPHRDKNQNIPLSTDAENTTQPARVTLASRPGGSRNKHVNFSEHISYKNIPSRLPVSEVLDDHQPSSSFHPGDENVTDPVLKLATFCSNSTPKDTTFPDWFPSPPSSVSFSDESSTSQEEEVALGGLDGK